MRRCLLLILTLVLAGPSVGRAQGEHVSIGFEAGASVSDQRGDDAFFVWDVVSPQGAVFLNVPLGSAGRVGLQVEAMFLGKGGRENTDKRLVPSSAPSDKLRMTFFEAPVLLRVALGGEKVRPVLFGGVGVAFKLSCRFETFPGNRSVKNDCEDVGLEQETTQFDGIVGAGLEVDAGQGVFVIDVRADVQLGSADDSVADLDFSNRELAVLVGYRVPLGAR